MSSLAEGQLFAGRYLVRRKLGEGGFAEVYLADESTGERSVAIKVLTPDGRDQKSYLVQTKARFEREVQLLARLRDPHTVRMFDAGEDEEGRLYLVFEVVPGRSLDQVLEESGPLPEPIVRHLLIQMLQALREAHVMQLLHRDIKPHNIHVYEYMGDPWTAKLLDFGIAKDLSPTDARVTQTGALVGTPRYMSPEQLMSQPLTPASDLYSLGVTAYEMLVGPDNMHGSTLFDQLHRIGESGALVVPGRTGGLSDVVHRMVEREPARRFANAQQALEALGAASVMLPSAPPAPRTHHGPVVAPRANRTLHAAVAALGVLILASLSMILLLPAREQGPAPVPTRRVSALALTQPGPKPQLVAEQPVEPPPEAPVSVLSGKGCGQAADRPGRRVSHDTADGLEVNVYTPPDYDPNRKYPVVMLIHDTLEGAKSLWWDSGFQQTAEEHSLIVIAPRDDMRNLDTPRKALEFTDQRLCLDPERLYVVGNGAGGKLAEFVKCESSLFRGWATVDYREVTKYDCAHPGPYIHFTTLKNKALPVEGGTGCVGAVVSLAAYEGRWGQLNQCAGERREVSRWKNNRCYAWDCTTPFQSCEVDAGRGWPRRTKPRGGDFIACDGESLSDYDMSGEIWRFFESTAKSDRQTLVREPTTVVPSHR